MNDCEDIQLLKEFDQSRAARSNVVPRLTIEVGGLGGDLCGLALEANNGLAIPFLIGHLYKRKERGRRVLL